TSGSRGGSATPIETANPEAGILVGKRKSYDTGGDDRSLPQPKYTETVGRSRGRMRLTLGQKLEILQLLDEEKMTRLEIARIYKCSDRTVSSCFANRATLRAEAGSAARKLKSKGRRAVGFPEVRAGRGFRISAPSPAIVERANEVVSLAGARTPRAKAIALFLFVRDHVKFGFTRRFDTATPEETLKIGMGHCNPQGALFASLLQAEGIPARQRFVNLSNGVLRGVLSPPPARLMHSYVELQLPGQDKSGVVGGQGGETQDWIRVDGYIADPELFHAAQARLAKEGRTEGFGVHVNGVNEWDGASDAFCQMADEKSQVTEDLGAFDEPRLLYESAKNFQSLPWPVRMAFGLIVRGLNSSLDVVRAEFVPPGRER
ncbi:unnamed protein product, partial [Hapterophycus canaliculatus]